MRYHSGVGKVEVDGLADWTRAALVDCAAIRPGFVARRGAGSHRAARRWAQRVTRLLRVDLRMAGLEHIDPERSHIVVPLHEGMFDPIAVLHLPLRLRFVVRSEIFEWPQVGTYLRATGQVAADPERGRAGYRRLLAGATAARDRGESLVVFPQGTVLGIETAFLPGAFRAAERTELPLLPVVLTGTHRIWEHPFSPRLRFGMAVGMRVLPPVDARVVSVAELEAEMKRIALSGEVPAPRRFDPDRDGWWEGHAYEIDPAWPELAERLARHRAAVSA